MIAKHRTMTFILICCRLTSFALRLPADQISDYKISTAATTNMVAKCIVLSNIISVALENALRILYIYIYIYIYIYNFLVNLYIRLTISSCYGLIPLSLGLIGGDDGLNTLCHSCGFACQQGVLKMFLGLGYLRS